MGVTTEIFLPIALFVIMFSLGLGLGPGDFRRIAVQPRDFLVGMVSQQAWILAFADVFFALTLLFGSLIFMTILIQKPKAAPPPDAAH